MVSNRNHIISNRPNRTISSLSRSIISSLSNRPNLNTSSSNISKCRRSLNPSLVDVMESAQWDLCFPCWYGFLSLVSFYGF